jgi:hypothetical protein
MSWSFSSWQAARRPWELEIDGRRWVARPVSAERVMAYQGALIGASVEQGWAETLKLLRDAFPWRPSYVWRGDPVKAFAEVIRVAPDAATEALQSFFPLLRGATAALSTSGTPSQP